MDKRVCPVCRNPACVATDASTCKPPTERRSDDRRVGERRFFERPEGRRRSDGRRIGDG